MGFGLGPVLGWSMDWISPAQLVSCPNWGVMGGKPAPGMTLGCSGPYSGYLPVPGQGLRYVTRCTGKGLG